MELILYTADYTGKAVNCLYPHEKKITNQKELVEAIAQDQVFAKYKDSYRSIENFISSSVIPLDCDNDHSEKPENWLTTSQIPFTSEQYSTAMGNLSMRFSQVFSESHTHIQVRTLWKYLAMAPDM